MGLSGSALSFAGRPEIEQFPEASGSGWSSGYFTLPMRIIVRSQVPGAGDVIGIGKLSRRNLLPNTNNCLLSGPGRSGCVGWIGLYAVPAASNNHNCSDSGPAGDAAQA